MKNNLEAIKNAVEKLKGEGFLKEKGLQGVCTMLDTSCKCKEVTSDDILSVFKNIGLLDWMNDIQDRLKILETLIEDDLK